ncbi:PH domain-containing protein [Flavivirga eckloniae]|uniref:YdbS-like PH domain-containing protein n=1 Tax=Flavivirga eckloniae TaxID=1803846 RepID=A0A2K9PVQ0_9FLAO|nr:PH domain-containing protein [Flavivirga eckloniae]AUP81145.1 hypothetical protein C1H87_21480 [Flavivirga eckloniae]
MMQTDIIRKAEFNPNIKTYIFLVTAFVLLISFIGIPILFFWFLGFGQYFSKRYYKTIECKLTHRHLEFKKGVMFKVEKTIPLENIQDLTFIDNPLLRVLDLRVLKIETAGQSNPRGSDLKLIGIKDSVEFKKHVLNQREVIRSGSKENEQNISSNEKTNMLLEEIRDLLNDIKNK